MFFFIQSLSRIISLEIDLTYIVIHYCFSEVLSCPLIHFLRVTLSLMTVLVSISYVTEIVTSSFFRVQISEITVVLVPVSISLSSVVTYPFSSRIVTERVIRSLSPDSLSVSELLRFPTCRRLREWLSFVWPYKIV